jgi:hypothetical protein
MITNPEKKRALTFFYVLGKGVIYLFLSVVIYPFLILIPPPVPVTQPNW